MSLAGLHPRKELGFLRSLTREGVMWQRGPGWNSLVLVGGRALTPHPSLWFPAPKCENDREFFQAFLLPRVFASSVALLGFFFPLLTPRS